MHYQAAFLPIAKSFYVCPNSFWRLQSVGISARFVLAFSRGIVKLTKYEETGTIDLSNICSTIKRSVLST